MILDYKGIQIFYTDHGTGNPIILLHGFLEDVSMWQDIVSKLSLTHRVVAIDLLGHGKTGSLSLEHTMLDMAKAVHAVIAHLNFDKIAFIGHSMGGYVSLAYAEEYKEKLSGLCLLNSTYEADSEDRQNLRTRANKMIKDNFKNMVRMSFSNLFSETSKVKFRSEFDVALQVAFKTSLEGYIAANEGMKNRKEQSEIFKNAEFYKIIILGKKDSILDYKPIVNFCEKHDITVHLLSEGHMSYIENKTELYNSIMHFVEKI